MSTSGIASSIAWRTVLGGAGYVVAALLAGKALARDDDHRGISQSGEQKNMRLVGHADLQQRPAYQPNAILYPDGRTIAFVGTHGGSKLNPLTGNVEPNGTMIIDVTDPSHPVQTAHIPVPVAGGQAQMARMCLGSVLPGGKSGSVYLLRNVQGSAAAGYEIWDVTNTSAPVPVAALKGNTTPKTPAIRSTHKDWWECTTGIAYMPGSRNLPKPDLWRTSQSMLIYDWSKPPAAAASGPIPVYADYPKYIRTNGVPGANPDGTGGIPNSLHGAISAFEHPQATQSLARGQDSIGNRIYAAWGVGDDGVLQIIDRKALLPSPWGNWVPETADSADRPTANEMAKPMVGLMYMSADQGGHTSMPIFGMQPASYGSFTEFKTRDIVVLTSEATADLCQESPHWAFLVDVTIENSGAVPPGTKIEQNFFQGPMVLSTMSVDPRRGAKYPRGNYCSRGARFGVHSNEENFNNPYYGKLTFLAYFTGGVRTFDIREPQSPAEVGFYVPLPAQTVPALEAAGGYMTNNLEVDNRGFIYATDRQGYGLDILELTGKARNIGLGRPEGDDD